MTIKAMNWAWGVDLPPAMKLVLLKLADRADDDGECWPGMDSVAKACGVSKSSIIRHVQKMQELGILSVSKRKGADGRQGTNVYTLNIAYEPGVKLTPGVDDPGVKSEDNRVSLVTPDKELKFFIETTEKPQARTDGARHPEPIAEDPVSFDGVKWAIDNAVYDSWLVAYQNGRTFQDTEDWIEAELAKAAIWRIANPRKAKKCWLRFLSGWLTRASQSTPYRKQHQTRPYH